MANAELKMLNTKRGTIKTKLTRFIHFIENTVTQLKESDRDTITKFILEIETRLANIEPLLHEFDNVQLEIEMLDTESEEGLTQREEFENNFYSIIAQAKKVIQDYEKLNQDEQTSSISVHSLAHNQKPWGTPQVEKANIKLPTIQLPTYVGNYEKWLEYHDTFESLIHKSTAINDMEKFHYLKASLGGEAAKVISSLEISIDNYAVAWHLLCERYANKKLLVHNHTKALFNLQQISKESSQQIRSLIDNISSHLRALKSLKQPIHEWDTLLIFIVSNKLDLVTAREWEAYKYEGDLPTFDNMITFLKNKADILEKIEANQINQDKRQNHTSQIKQRSAHNPYTNKAFLASNQITCVLCKSSHRLYNCPDYLKLTVHARTEQARKLQLCLNCLNAGHTTNACRFGPCKKCPKKHNTLLHVDQQQNVQSTSSNTAPSSESRVSLSNYNSIQINQTLLSTVIFQVKDKNSKVWNCRAILDSASQSNYISSELCHSLGLAKQKVDIMVQGIGQISSPIKYKCNVDVEACNSAYSTSVSCLVISAICDLLPTQKINIDELNIPPNIRLADPTFFEPSKVDILIGAGLFWQLLCVGQIQLGPDKPVLHKTKFGWIVSGSLNMIANTYLSGRSICNFTTNSYREQHDELSRFWAIEECPSEKTIFSQEERECESHFISTFKRDVDGRFVVSIPIKHSINNLGDSKQTAINRFYSLERKLQNNISLRNMYTQFMQQYEAMGHMTKVENDFVNLHSKQTETVEYFMPHHGVLREDSLTTKLRVVFNASSPSTSGWSFNDCQMVGPTIQSDLFSILLRFRQYTYVVSADIEKMYRMVWINADQRSLQQIVWRENPSESLSTYQLNTITYGTASAPFLAIRSLYQLSIENRDTFPEAARIIADSFYVDDLLTGDDSIQNLSKNSVEVSQILKQSGFPLRKWISNDPRVLAGFQVSDDSSYLLKLGPNENSKTLGVIWSSQTDTLIFSIAPPANSTHSTKRSILSGIAQIYDPLGLLSPCIIIVKIILQKLWQEKLSWDEAVSMDIHTTWIKFRDELSNLNNFKISRHVRCKNPVRVEFHGFSDSSQYAYGACIYIRSVDEHGNVSVNLLCAKSKVAPIKSISIPRLELCGALILAKLSHKIFNSLHYKFDEAFYWTDSTIVLGWVNTQPNLLKTFVANRISEIQTMTNPNQWQHVNTNDNPADLLSRGVSPNIIQSSYMWWHGPRFLSQAKDTWLKTDPNIVSELPDLKPTSKYSWLNQELDTIPINRFSNLNRLIRSIAYCIRFKHNCLNPKSNRNIGPLTSQEVQYALICIIKQVQLESFSSERTRLCQSKPLSGKSKIVSLHPFIDEQGIIRVGGRINQSNFSYDKKHPMLLPANHHFTKLVFDREHKRLFHAGPQHLLASVRETYWPIHGKSQARQTYRTCIRCFKANPKEITPMMGSLPQDRVSESFPFYVTGVDYCGPLYIKDRKGRGCKILKAYVCIFVCFAVKAIHIELVNDLTSESFIAALKRFMSRRGKPAKLYSDNGTNFVGANNELKELYHILHSNQSAISNSCAVEGVEWHFIPSHSPHFGGLWEAGVKSMKTHLKRVVGTAHFTYEELLTILVQVEAILNSRPLTPLSSNPSDLEPITPAHFLIGRTLISIPDPTLTELNENRLSRFQRLQQILQHFWQRWSLEYISELQTRCKWTKIRENLPLDTLVLIKDKRLPPLKWLLGRVIGLHPGPDGINRVVSIQTSNGVIKRGVSTICPLPMEPNQ